VAVRNTARGGLLRPGALVEAGVAVLEPHMTAEELFWAAAAALCGSSTSGGVPSEGIT
jgi:hypothetical protein